MSAYDLPLAQLERYRPDLSAPADLDDFWRTTLAAAREVATAPSREPADAGLTLVTVDDVTFPGHGGTPVRGWWTRPAGVTGPLPVVVEYLGYGRGRGVPGERLTWAAAGYAHLLMDTRGQGSTYGSGGATPDPAGSGPAVPGVVTRGIEAPAEWYWTRLVVDAVRAVDAACLLEGVTPSSVAVCGNSQGGGLALAVAGLLPEVGAVMANVPFMSHVRRGAEISTDGPYQELVRYLSVHRDAVDRVFATTAYGDVAHLVPRATAPLLAAVGLQDTICPPSTVFTAYNRYGDDAGVEVRKRIAVLPYNHHEGGDSYHLRHQLLWLRDEVRLTV